MLIVSLFLSNLVFAASEFVECVTDDLLGQSVFVFTPSGEVRLSSNESFALCIQSVSVFTPSGEVRRLFLSQLHALGSPLLPCNLAAAVRGVKRSCPGTATGLHACCGNCSAVEPTYDPLFFAPQVVRLPKGATAVDFAYHIHTEVRCAAYCCLGIAMHVLHRLGCWHCQGVGALALFCCCCSTLCSTALSPRAHPAQLFPFPALPRWATPWWAPRSTASWCQLRGSCRTRVGAQCTCTRFDWLYCAKWFFCMCPAYGESSINQCLHSAHPPPAEVVEVVHYKGPINALPFACV